MAAAFMIFFIILLRFPIFACKDKQNIRIRTKNKSIFVFCLGYLTEKLIPIAGPEK